jgi:type VI secretion system secreted protein VgrG
MAAVTLQIFDAEVDLRCRELRGAERLGEASSFELAAVSPDAIDPATVVGKRCAITIETASGSRSICGVVARFTVALASREAAMRRYRLLVQSSFALLALRRRTQVYQRQAAADIIRAVLEGAGWPSSAVEMKLSGSHAEREYVVQYAETDAAFIRRLCEEEGIYFRLRAEGEGEVFVLEDTSAAAPAPLPSALTLIDASSLTTSGLFAYDAAVKRRARAGKVTLRDYNPKQPSLELEGSQEAGTDAEKGVEVYAAPGRFRSSGEGKSRAAVHLAALRADAKTVTLRTNALALSCGDAFAIEVGPDYAGGARPEGELVAAAIEHAWTIDDPDQYRYSVEAVSKEQPFRLPLVTPRPRASGLHTAIVTGEPGVEVDPDKEGNVFVRFPWDREGAKGRGTSLPVRVAQPNTGESMLIPRVGWEVFVAFEDSDPDRPYVVGRGFNAKTPPPFSLPANKTVTSLGTFSSPGGGDRNQIHFDDAAGRQHVSVHAAFAKTTTVANDMTTQVAKVEKVTVTGDQTRAVGTDESTSVKQAYIVHAASQSATVGGSQSIYVKGNVSVAVDSEAVVVGGACLEKVGNPVTGAVNLGVSAVIAGAGAVGGRLGPVGAVVSSIAAAAGGMAWGAHLASNAPGAGPNAGRDGSLNAALGIAAGFVPGGDAILASIQSAGVQMPWGSSPPPSGHAAVGGGAGGAASDSAAAQGPGPGHRNTIVKGAMLEMIGGLHSVLTPGSIQWQTAGAAAVTVGGSRSIKAVTVGCSVLGASTDTLGSFHIKAAKDIQRTARGSVKTTIGGSLKSEAGAHHVITAESSVKLKVGGSLTMKGSHVTFVCGSSTVSASPGGVLIKAGTITITGASKQSGETDHS